MAHNKSPNVRNLERYRRPAIAAGAALGFLLIVLFHFLLPDDLARILIDRGGVTYPFSVQNGMWVAFFIGLAEIWIRILVGNRELTQLRQRYLPEDRATMLQSEDLIPIYQRLKPMADSQDFLPRLISRAILQFQSSRSVEQSNMLLHSSVDMYLHEVDLRYSLIRYITWLIPSLGFIGTVLGIGSALRYAGDNASDPELLSHVTSRLAVSFNGTLVALVLAAVLAFLTNIAQAREEQALNRAAQYCLDNLINRLFAR